MKNKYILIKLLNRILPAPKSKEKPEDAEQAVAVETETVSEAEEGVVAAEAEAVQENVEETAAAETDAVPETMEETETVETGTVPETVGEAINPEADISSEPVEETLADEPAGEPIAAEESAPAEAVLAAEAANVPETVKTASVPEAETVPENAGETSATETAAAPGEEPAEQNAEETVTDETSPAPDAAMTAAPAVVTNEEQQNIDAVPEKKKRKKVSAFKNNRQRLLAGLSFLLGILLIMAGVVTGIFRYYYGLTNYVEADGSVSYASVDEEITLDSAAEASVLDQVTASEVMTSDIHKSVEGAENREKVTHATWHIYLQSGLEDKDLPELADETDGMYNVLLIGVDRHDDTWYGNSDVMIVVTINYRTKKVWLSSFMRDTAVNVPGVGIRKLNAAYANGGTPLLIQTLEQNFDLRIDNYALVEFSSLKKVVNAMGGLDLYLTEAEEERLRAKNYTLKETKKDRVFHLTGAAVLAYCRNRKDVESDFGRTNRQRNVLMAMVNKAKSKGLSYIMSVARKALPYVTHNITMDKINRLIFDSTSIMEFTFSEQRIPFEGTFTMAGEFLVPDYVRNKLLYYNNISN